MTAFTSGVASLDAALFPEQLMQPCGNSRLAPALQHGSTVVFWESLWLCPHEGGIVVSMLMACISRSVRYCYQPTHEKHTLSSSWTIRFKTDHQKHLGLFFIVQVRNHGQVPALPTPSHTVILILQGQFFMKCKSNEFDHRRSFEVIHELNLKT